MKVVLTPPFIDLRFLIGVSVRSSCLEGDMDIAKIVCVCLFISFVILWVLGGIFLTVYVTKDDKMETSIVIDENWKNQLTFNFDFS